MSTISDDDLTENVMAALRRVIDPELGYNIVDLGLVYGVDVDKGAVHIVMTTTTRGCPATDYLRGGANHAAESALGVDSVDVELTYDPPWMPDKMSPQAKAHLGIGRGG
ncbi:metal-sulfur cluster assembly factor [Hephaestia sp. GCM10023244]|uniref:metal-sulfur cluster assembly factor n=1 Tax=unclassified Hephaestia TaxID=2631281 RepID=UPI0020779106|nr:metal-sulfur cluster assembly factor [Hephaestia sp. MAHUQ-44]MCM8729787.1 metal-sulfur cluster assembly factor [Hephaestia sp. MAHUQ-44]